jgi:hypothetical protein
LVTISNGSVVSASANLAAMAASSGSGQVVSISALPVQTLSNPTVDANTQQAQSASTSTISVGQSPAASSSLGQGLQPQSRSSEWGSADDAQPQPTGGIDYVEPMPPAGQGPTPPPEPAPALSPEEVPAQPPADPGWPSLDLTIDGFDEALAQVAESLPDGRLEPLTADPAEADGSRKTRPGFYVPTLVAPIVGTVALAAGGYRLVRRQPDERRRQWRN